MNAPWAPPGRYTVRLTANGTRYEQPLTLRLDPRVKTPAAALARLHALSSEMYRGAVETHRAFVKARAVITQLNGMRGADVDILKAQLEVVAPSSATARNIRGFRRRGAATTATSLEGTSTAMLSAAMAMHNADVAPTASQVAACAAARAMGVDVLPKWNALRATGIAAFNAKRKSAGLPTLTLP